MTNNFFIILDGPMGAGKTTVTNILFHKLKRTVVLSFDVQKLSITDFGLEREKDYKMISSVRKSIAIQYMKHGFNILMDGGFFSGEKIKPFINLAKTKGYRLFIYHLEASTETLLKRAVDRSNLGSERNKISEQNIQNYISFHAENKYQGEEVVKINSGELSPEEIVSKILVDIGT